MAKVEPGCSCACGGRGRRVSARRAMFAGALGGILGVVAMAALAAFVIRRAGPRLMPRMMERMMRECECSSEMQACMERCGCGPSAEKQPAS